MWMLLEGQNPQSVLSDGSFPCPYSLLNKPCDKPCVWGGWGESAQMRIAT